MEFKSQEHFTDTINSLISKGKEQGFSTNGISDNWHTFEELYDHRMMLFTVILNNNKDIAWKSKFHFDGTMFEDFFVCGIDTPDGQFTYHYHLKHWEMFKVPELDRAPEWDGHKPEDITRLLSLEN